MMHVLCAVCCVLLQGDDVEVFNLTNQTYNGRTGRVVKFKMDGALLLLRVISRHTHEAMSCIPSLLHKHTYSLAVSLFISLGVR